jgi:oxygen-independent coproporphyrinogen-3 oxidase
MPVLRLQFARSQGGRRLPEQEYLDALRTDLEMALPLIWGRKIYTIFIGGGTPSLMSAAGLDRLLSDVRTLLPLDSDARSRWKPTPAPSRQRSSSLTAPAA